MCIYTHAHTHTHLMEDCKSYEGKNKEISLIEVAFLMQE